MENGRRASGTDASPSPASLAAEKGIGYQAFRSNFRLPRAALLAPSPAAALLTGTSSALPALSIPRALGCGGIIRLGAFTWGPPPRVLGGS